MSIQFSGITVQSLNDEYNRYAEMLNLEINNIVNTLPRCFAHTIQPLINAETIGDGINKLGIVENFYPEQELRDVAIDLQKKKVNFEVELFRRKDIYQSFNEYFFTIYQSERSSLTPEERRYVEQTNRNFRRMGMHLPDNDQEILKRIDKELVSLSLEYNKRLNEWDEKLEFSKEELTGLPNDWLNERLQENGLYIVSLDYPAVLPLIRFCQVEKTRKTVRNRFQSRGGRENLELLNQARVMRHQMSKILGYENYVDYVTEVNMIKSGQNALNFLENLRNSFLPAYLKELDELTQYAINHPICPLRKKNLDEWDITFYSELYIKDHCDIDKLDLRKYFPVNVVVNGALKIYQNLLGLTFTQLHTNNIWHPDVKVYEVTDSDNGTLLGHFYLDLYQRRGKYTHAAVFPVLQGGLVTDSKGTHRLPSLAVMACNFPTTVLSFDDVETFFHEFGHVMHNICSNTQLTSFGGTSVERDFVEAPSQMLEYWCYEKESLQIMSQCKETGESIPEVEVNKLIKAKTTMETYNVFRQLSFGLFDIACHTGSPNFDAQKLWIDTNKKTTGFETAPDVLFPANFGHLMGGYSAGYYGYMYALTLAANMYFRKFKGKLLDPKMGRMYRQTVLAVGSSLDGDVIIRNFLGGEPDPKYLLLHYGFDIDM